MKKVNHKLLTVLGLGILSNPAIGIEAPPEDVPSITIPGDNARDAFRLEHRGANTQVPEMSAATAYLGAGTGEVPDVLASHLGLKPGEGIVINSLDPGGPATSAGFAVYDVILRANGEVFSTPADLSRLVLEKKPGDEISFDLIREGKAETRKVILGARPTPMAESPASPDTSDIDGLFLGMPNDRIRSLRDSLRRGLRSEGGIHDVRRRLDELNHPEINDVVREMERRVERLLRGGSSTSENSRELNYQNESTFRLMDEQGSVELKSKNGAKNVSVRGKNGDVVWAGPWETEEDKAAAPAEVRERIEALNIDSNFKGTGFRLQYGTRSRR